MAFTVSCADTGAKCPGSFTCESKEELMEHVKIHAAKAHSDMPAPPPEMVERLIKVS